MKGFICNAETITKIFLSAAGSILGLIAIIRAFISWDDLQDRYDLQRDDF